MRKVWISQEGLKTIACLCMLLDHIGTVLFSNVGLRIAGRLAFPVYCFLLTEGAAHTKNPRRYGLRLLIGALISELPYDLLFFDGLSWEKQNVMVTLLLGLWMINGLQKAEKSWQKLLLIAAFALIAEAVCADYGAVGVLMIALFALTRDRAVQAAALALTGLLSSGLSVTVFGLDLPIQLFGVLAMVPIGLYAGQKRTSSRGLQWAFYLFYPAHLLALWMILALQ